MNATTEKLQAMCEKARQLKGTGGGEALALCLEGLELLRQRARSLDVANKWLVVEAVAEAMGMSVEEVSGQLDEEIWVPRPSVEPGPFGQLTVVLAGTVPRRTLPAAFSAPVVPPQRAPSTAPMPTFPDGANP